MGTEIFKRARCGVIGAVLTLAGAQQVEAQTDFTKCAGTCANRSTFLRAGQVQRIIAQAVGEARVRGVPATIAVVDRVGNVLAIFQMNGATDQTVRIRSGRFNRNSSPGPFQAGLDEVFVRATQAAVSKAITGAYLSSEGNAFGSRTANQIVRENFNPGERGQPSGPLFGVQFSQLACGDLVQKGTAIGIGPRAAPLGLAADSGGLPLYMRGTVVGGIGVIADGIYGGDPNIQDTDNPNTNVDEMIAVAGSVGFAPPIDRRAERITVGGLSLRLSDGTEKKLRSNPARERPFAQINGVVGTLRSLPNFYSAADGVRDGVPFGQPSSGIEPAKTPLRGLDAFMLSDGAGNNRFPPVDGAVNGGQQLTASEVTTLLRSAMSNVNREKAQIRRPTGTLARVTIAVVDHAGAILGIVRSRDAPVFGIDVSLQKARTAAFFSSPDAAAVLLASQSSGAAQIDLGRYVRAAQQFVDPPFRGRLFADGTAWSNRAIGNIARPLFPDGIDGTPHGPLSKPFRRDRVFAIGRNEWSPFNDGLQLDLVFNDLASTVVDQPRSDCTASFGGSIAPGRLANGIQIFAGSVPVYKSGVLVGAIGISGDGIDQDDMTAFFGLDIASRALRGSIQNAPRRMRADQVSVDRGDNAVHLRYVQCPIAPFVNSDEQRPCKGK